MEQNILLGVAANFLAAFCYGTTYIPVRFFETGDGIFLQWLMTIGQFVVGCAVYFWCGCPEFVPLVMVSGVLYALGNSLTIFIMSNIGMAVGSLCWNTCSCIVGWAVSRFGLFGTRVQEPVNNTLNIVGVLMVCCGALFFIPIKYNQRQVRPAPAQYKEVDGDCEKNTKEKKVSGLKRLMSFLLTAVVGGFYGTITTPTNYVIENSLGPLEAKANFFAHCVGALLTSTTIFTVYALIRKNRPFVNPEIILPSMAAGALYGTAVVSLFTACQNLGQIIAFPITTRATGVINSLWAVFLFKEIKGKWNLISLSAGIMTTLFGVVLISLSRMEL